MQILKQITVYNYVYLQNHFFVVDILDDKKNTFFLYNDKKKVKYWQNKTRGPNHDLRPRQPLFLIILYTILI